MAITHNYLNTSGFKPTAGEVLKAELVPNLADGTLWTEDNSGTVIQIGGGTYTGSNGVDITGSAVTLDFSTLTDQVAAFDGTENLIFNDGGVESYRPANEIDLSVFNNTTSAFVTNSTLSVATANILDSNVTLAKIEDIATDSFLGRDTAGSGPVEVLSVSTMKSLLDIISSVDKTDLTDSGDSTLHYHATDRNRANHTGTQLLATISDSGTAAAVDTGTTSGTVPLLNGSGQIPDGMIPALAITETSTVASEVLQLALTVQEGDVAIRTDESKSYVALNDTNASMSDWAELLSPTGTATSLGYTSSATQGEITNNTGANAIIPTATSAGGTNIAGLLTPAQFDKLTNTSGTNSGDNAVNSLYSGLDTNVDTTISTGTRTTTTYPTDLDGGGTWNIALATTAFAGIMSSAQFDKLADGVLLTGESA